MDAEDVAAYRGHDTAREINARVEYHPGWSEEKVMDEVRRCVRSGMNPAELYDWWPPE
jgi:hypothetical protein